MRRYVRTTGIGGALTQGDDFFSQPDPDVPDGTCRWFGSFHVGLSRWGIRLGLNAWIYLSAEGIAIRPVLWTKFVIPGHQLHRLVRRRTVSGFEYQLIHSHPRLPSLMSIALLEQPENTDRAFQDAGIRVDGNWDYDATGNAWWMSEAKRLRLERVAS